LNRAAATVEEYLGLLPADRRGAVEQLRLVLRANLPAGIEETIAYGMIGYVIPHTIYPAGYHANPAEPLPFMSIAWQKHHLALYHLGLYAFPGVTAWFVAEYQQLGIGKLDMAKSCIRFRRPALIPFELIAKLCGKISIAEYIARYEETTKSRRRAARTTPIRSEERT